MVSVVLKAASSRFSELNNSLNLLNILVHPD
jgi:hypothetical protein